MFHVLNASTLRKNAKIAYKNYKIFKILRIKH